MSTNSSAFSIEKIDESEFNMAVEEEEGEGTQENNVEDEEQDDWLITPATATKETSEGCQMADADRRKQVFKPFQEGFSTSDWLLKSDCGSCCAIRTEAVEIENLGKLECLKSPPASGTTRSICASTLQTASPWLPARWRSGYSRSFPSSSPAKPTRPAPATLSVSARKTAARKP